MCTGESTHDRVSVPYGYSIKPRLGYRDGPRRFLKGFWSMFGPRIKLYMDWLEDKNRPVKSSDSRRDLLLRIKKVAISEIVFWV